MKRQWMPMLLFCLLVLMALACGSSAPAALPTPIPNNQATIDAAIAATVAAQSNIQATIDAAIAATAVAAPPTATPAPTTEVVQMTEEELEALINQAVNDAVAATTQASTATTQATADQAVTQEEVDGMVVYVDGAEEAIAYAEQLIDSYYSLYGDLAAESVALLTEVEQDLEEMATATEALAQELAQVESTLAAGLSLATETVTQLENTAQQATQSLQQVQAVTQNWLGKAQIDREHRANAALSIKPDNIPADLPSTLSSAFDFVDLVRNSLGDNKLSRDELNLISQLGANVSAGFNNHGGPKMQGFSGKVNEIVGQLARGQTRHAREGLGNFEKSLGQRPAGPGLKPGGGLPGRP